MPTKNPRLTITLNPELAAQLRRLSHLTGSSQGALIGELLEGSSDVFAKIIATLEAAQKATASMRGQLVTDMAAAQGRIEDAIGFSTEAFDKATLPLFKEAESIKRRGRRAATASAPAPTGGGRAPVPGLPSTPISNRGVRSLTNTTKTIAQSSGTARGDVVKRVGKPQGVH
jgi:hypothetical protein